MAFDTNKACVELIARVDSLCKQAKTKGLSPREQGKLDVYVWFFAMNLSDRYNSREHAASEGAVIVSRLAAEKGAHLEPQPTQIESSFDIVISSGRYDLLATMQNLLAMSEPVKRSEG